MTLTKNSQHKWNGKLKELQENWSAAVNANPPLDVSSKDTYHKLFNAVDEATKNNESESAFKDRVIALGKGVQDLAKTLGVLA